MRREAPFPSRRAALVAALAALGASIAWMALSIGSTWHLERTRARFLAAVDRVEPVEGRPRPLSAGEEDAVQWLSDGMAVLAIDEEESTHLLAIIRRAPGSWSPAEREMVTALARREAEALALLERAGALHGGSTSAALDGGRLLEGGVQLLRGTQLLLARAGLALHDGPTDAGRTLLAVAGIARTLETGSGSAHQIFATTVEGLYLRGVHWMAEDPTVPATVAADLLDGLSTTSSAARIRSMVALYGGAAADDGADPPATWWRRLERASTLATLRRLAEAADEPAALARMAGPGERASGGPEDRPDEALAALVIPELVNAALEMQAVEASRALARLALGLRLQAAIGGSPATLRQRIERRLAGVEPDPFAGVRPEVELEDEAVLVTNRAAAAAWERRWGRSPGKVMPPPFAWRLPRRLFQASLGLLLDGATAVLPRGRLAAADLTRSPAACGARAEPGRPFSNAGALGDIARLRRTSSPRGTGVAMSSR